MELQRKTVVQERKSPAKDDCAKALTAQRPYLATLRSTQTPL